MRRGLFALTGSGGEVIYTMTLEQARVDYLNRRVAETVIGSGRRRVRISTALILEPPPGFRDFPSVWETLVSGGPEDELRHQFASRAEARIGHRALTIYVRQKIDAKRARDVRRRRMHASYHARRA